MPVQPSEDGEVLPSGPTFPHSPAVTNLMGRNNEDGSCTPMVVPRGLRRLDGLDEMINSLDASGMTIRGMGTLSSPTRQKAEAGAPQLPTHTRALYYVPQRPPLR